MCIGIVQEVPNHWSSVHRFQMEMFWIEKRWNDSNAPFFQRLKLSQKMFEPMPSFSSIAETAVLNDQSPLKPWCIQGQTDWLDWWRGFCCSQWLLLGGCNHLQLALATSWWTSWQAICQSRSQEVWVDMHCALKDQWWQLLASLLQTECWLCGSRRGVTKRPQPEQRSWFCGIVTRDQASERSASNC